MGHGFIDKVTKSAEAPWEMLKASDPFTQFVTGNKVDFNPDHNLDAALNEAYDSDPVGNSLLTKDDYKRTGKIAAAAAAIYFGGGAALSAANSGGAAAGTTAAGTTAAEGLGSAGAASAGAAGATSATSTGLTLLKTVAPTVLSTLMRPKGGAAEAGEIPEVTAPVTMPTPNSNDVAKARKKSLIQQMQNRGRASTILTGNSERLGG